MATAIIDGIETRYDIVGEGPPLLMFSPGGFDATLEKWSTQGIYKDIRPVEHLAREFRCIVYDRRETGQSGGRVERFGWEHFVAQGRGLLDHLGIDKAHLMGGCMGCSPVSAFGVAHPERVLSMILFWPVGGVKYRMTAHQRFAEHLAFVHQNGLQAVVDLAREGGKSFGGDPRGGPWASVLKRDADFAANYALQDLQAYKVLVQGIVRTLFDRDTAPGPEPEDMLRLDIPTLIVPGADGSHATSAAMYLHECIPGSEYWNVPVSEQTEAATADRLLQFLRKAA